MYDSGRLVIHDFDQFRPLKIVYAIHAIRPGLYGTVPDFDTLSRRPGNYEIVPEI